MLKFSSLSNREWRLVLFLWAAASTGISSSPGAPSESQWPRAGTELFVDDARITKLGGVTRKIHPAVKPPHPVIEGDNPWEDGRVYIYGSVYRDPITTELRMWYGSSKGKLLYATSRDGLNWTKPELGIFQYEGKETNIVMGANAGATVLVDEAETNPDRRYKALIAIPRSARKDGGFNGFYSSDGLHWNPYPGNPVLPFGAEMANLVRDPTTRKYHAYIRPYWVKHEPARMEEKRLGAVTTSDDFHYWSEMKVVLQPDAIDDAWAKGPVERTEFYAMNGFAYGNSYLGVVPLFRIIKHNNPKTIGPNQSSHDGPMEGQLITSRNGLEWRRMSDRSPIIPSGPDFDKSVMNVATAPVIVGDEVLFYYTGINTGHGGPVPPKRIAVCLAKWRLDGFVSLDAGEAGGVVETTPFSAVSGVLQVNANAAGGTLVVEVLDEAGRVQPGYEAANFVPLKTDDVRHKIAWTLHKDLPTGAPLRLRFTLRNAALYSYTL